MPELTPIEPNQVVNIPLGQIEPDPEQPRGGIDELALEELAADIKARGVQQPITIIKPQNGDEYYRIKTGERRYRASRLAGKQKIPCILASLEKGDDKRLERLFDQVKENHLREDLNPLDWARTFKRLKDDFGMTVKQIAEACAERGLENMSRPHVSNILRLTELPDWAQSAIRDGRLTAAHGKYLFTALHSEPVTEDIQTAIAGADPDARPALSVRELQDAIHETYNVHHRKCWELAHLDPKDYLFDLKAHAEELGLVSVSVPDRKPVPFVINEERYLELLTEAREKQREQHSQRTHGDEGDEGDETDDDQEARDVHPHWNNDGQIDAYTAAHNIDRSITNYARQQLLEAFTDHDLQRLAIWCATDYFESGDYTEYYVEPFGPEMAEVLAAIGATLENGWDAFRALPATKIEATLAAIGKLVVTSGDDALIARLAHSADVRLEDGYRIDVDYCAALSREEVDGMIATIRERLGDTAATHVEGWEATVELLTQHAELFGIPDGIKNAWEEFVGSTDAGGNTP